MGYGHSGAALAVLALVASTALLIWVEGKAGICCQKFAKFIAWVAILVSALLLIGQVVMCAQYYRGHCMRPMPGMGMPMPGEEGGKAGK
ncbi:MAG: hypothetical protein V2A66_08275 [Pseudomonadota bacterium]